MEQLSNTLIFDLFKDDNETLRKIIIAGRLTPLQIINEEIEEGYLYMNSASNCLLKASMLKDNYKVYGDIYDLKTRTKHNEMVKILRDKFVELAGPDKT